MFPKVENWHKLRHPLGKNVLIPEAILKDIIDEFHLTYFFPLLTVSDESRDIHHR